MCGFVWREVFHGCGRAKSDVSCVTKRESVFEVVEARCYAKRKTAPRQVEKIDVREGRLGRMRYVDVEYRYISTDLTQSSELVVTVAVACEIAQRRRGTSETELARPLGGNVGGYCITGGMCSLSQGIVS